MEVTNEGKVVEWEPEVEELAEVVAELPEEGEEEEVGADQGAAEEQPALPAEPEPTPVHEIQNPQARARILERENRILRQRTETILNALMQQNLSRQDVASAQQRADESVPDIEHDPLGAMFHEIKSIKEQLAANQLALQQATEVGTEQQKLAYADALIRQTASQAPDVFKKAATYLATLAMEQAMDEYPDKTEDELVELIDIALKREKIKMVEHGKNPGEEYMKRAIRFGFKLPTEQTPISTESEQKTAPAREKIRKDKERDSRAASIGKVTSSPARQPASARALANLTEDQFTVWVDENIKNGTMQASTGRYGRSPKMSDLLPGKGIDPRRK